MAKMTNAEAQSLINCFDEISSRNANLPVQVWYALAKNKEKLDSVFKLCEKARINLVEKYGAPDEKNPNSKKVAEDKMPEFQKEYIELLDIEVEIDVHKIKLSLMEKEVKSMQGVRGIYMFFSHFIEDDLTDAPKMEVVK